MKLTMGQPQRLKNQAERGSDRVKLKEGENVHRVLFGPVVVNTTFWPSKQQQDDGELKEITRAVKVPDRGSIFEGIAALDRKIQRASGVERPKSQLDANTKYCYLVIDLNKEPLRVSIASYPKSVKDALIEIEEKRDTDDATCLRYGLVWMYNMIISKDVDPSQARQFGTEYTVEPDPKNPWLGQVPADWLKADFNQLVEDKMIDLTEVFTPEMLKAIEEAEIDLEAEGVPDPEEKILEQLAQYPIDLNATRFDKPAFPNPEIMMKELEVLKIPFLAPGEGAPQLPATTATAGTEAPAAVEAEFEVVDTPPSEGANAKKLNDENQDEVEAAASEEAPAAASEEAPAGLKADAEEPAGDKPSKLRSLLKSAQDKASA